MDMMGEVKSTRTDIPEIIFGEQIRDRTVNLVAESGQVSSQLFMDFCGIDKASKAIVKTGSMM